MPLLASPRLLLTLQRKTRPLGRGKDDPATTLPPKSSVQRTQGSFQRLANPSGPSAWHLLQTPAAARTSMVRLSIEMLTPGEG